VETLRAGDRAFAVIVCVTVEKVRVLGCLSQISAATANWIGRYISA
jgi:hypothetical protein